jgi:urease accessory protein UreH
MLLKVNESLQLADSKQRSNTLRIDSAIGSIWAVDEVKAMMEKNMKEFSILSDEENVATDKVQKKTKDNMAAAFGPMEGGDIEMNTVIKHF